jgi:hypothetical protein
VVIVVENADVLLSYDPNGVRLPVVVFGLLLGREWFVDAATTPVAKPATGIFSSG